LNMSVGTGFRVGGYSTLATILGKMDEFRLYNRALDSAEIATTWNITIPVELTSFVANVIDGNVVLQWETATETNNKGFQIERKSENSEFISIGFVPSYGTTTEPKFYSYTDKLLQNGKYTYRLKQIDYDGSFKYSDNVDINILTPLKFSLEQNYPNPFNPLTNIQYTIGSKQFVNLKVYNALGREVATLVNEEKAAGKYIVPFDASNLPSGVYYYKIEFSNFTSMQKMILLK
jgi:Secretion system C-terminal sorting domain